MSEAVADERRVTETVW